MSPYRKNIKASAICQYAFSDVQKVFEGPYMEVQDSKWREFTGKVPEPRPGSVSSSYQTLQRDLMSRDEQDDFTSHLFSVLQICTGPRALTHLETFQTMCSPSLEGTR